MLFTSHMSMWLSHLYEEIPIVKFFKMVYGLTNAQRRGYFNGQISYVRMGFNSLLMYAPHNEQLLDVQSQVITQS